MLKKIRYRIGILSVLYPFAGGVRRFILFNLIISLFVMGLGFIKPLFYKLFINEVIINHRFPVLSSVITGYFIIFAMNLLFGYIKAYSTNRLVNRVVFRVKMRILRGFLRQDFINYDRQSVGDMKMRLDDDTGCIASYAGSQTVDYLIAYATIPIAAALLFILEWRLALFSITAIPLTFYLDHIVAKRESVIQNEQRENDQKMSSWLHASLQGWREIKALNLQKHEERQFARYIHKFAIYFGTWINYWVLRVLVIPKIKDEFIMQFSLYFIGGLLILRRHFDIGSLLVFVQYHIILSTAVKTVSSTDADLVTTRPQSDRMLAELKRSSEMNTNMQTVKVIPCCSKKIEFLDVSFSYPETDTKVVQNLSFFIDKGERVAITGRSGTGKTTVLKLLTGMLFPTEGRVLFSGIDIKMIPLDMLHNRIGFIMQENILFNTTIRENLKYGKPDASEAELEDACCKANILDFINRQPNGMNTVIGEKGIKLSGGQKQRIVLARQFLRDIDIFILDEATSALDQYSESIIHDAIISIAADKTIIIVAHRQSSISLCNRIIAL